MEIQNLATAVSSIPHIGQVLSVMLTVAVGIYEELKTLDSKLEAQKRLGEDANFIINTIVMYSKNLMVRNPNHLQRLARQLQQLEKIAKDIQRHILEASAARERHIRKYGKLPANVYDALAEPARVHILKKQLEEAKIQLLTDFLFIRMMEGDGADSEPLPFYAEIFGKEEDKKEPEPRALEPIRWVSMKEFVTSPALHKLMVPVCRPSETGDGVVWYIARVPHVGGTQPGKFSPGRGAFFGFKRESLFAKDLNFDILIANPGTLQWERTFGRFSQDQLDSRPVTGCCENDGTELVIARALAREHMHIGVFGKMFLQPGKASPKLEGAYVIAGEKEVKVKEYEVLVYTKPRKKLIL